MCDDLEVEMIRLGNLGVRCGSVTDEGWGLLTTVHLPSGDNLGLYEPRHASPHRRL